MTALTLAKPEDIDRIARLVADFHAEQDITQTHDARIQALTPLLEGSPHGAIYLIGPGRAPIGYAVVSFGWSIELGGLDGFLDEIYIRPAVRGRGIGTEVLMAIPKALSAAGLRALHLEVDRGDEKTRKLYEKLHFEPRDRYILMTRKM
jgi:ribosomal protein S18 acetylase RimI-like enzyme